MARAAPPSPRPSRPPRSRWAWIVSTVAALGAAARARLPARRSPPTARRSTSATTSGCSGSTSALASAAGRGDRRRRGAPALARARAAASAAGCCSSWRRSSPSSASCPGVLIYAVSYQFVSRSIESWFDVKVEGALDAGLNLGRGTIDAIVTDLGDQDAPGRRAPRRERAVGRAAGARAAARAALGAGGRASSAAPARP